ncbi:hypothetical protein L6164_010948 [Bauhinia variegata]|uniref:Uncharacterized protein n=1 Tax=Bauhinia variegata TaxID=167791 RepID=A0ACB9P441_BAUVA|nr:hypothetical protein L6164_010948 [Bauhinia variegata]
MFVRHAHYQTGITPLALVWKDEKCSQYVIDTDNKGQVPTQQQVVLELQEDGKLTTSDDPPVVFGYLDGSIRQQSGLQSGCLLGFAVGERGLVFWMASWRELMYNVLARSIELEFLLIVSPSVRHSPLRIDDLSGFFNLSADHENRPSDIEMDG